MPTCPPHPKLSHNKRLNLLLNLELKEVTYTMSLKYHFVNTLNSLANHLVKLELE